MLWPACPKHCQLFEMNRNEMEIWTTLVYTGASINISTAEIEVYNLSAHICHCSSEHQHRWRSGLRPSAYYLCDRMHTCVQAIPWASHMRRKCLLTKLGVLSVFELESVCWTRCCLWPYSPDAFGCLLPFLFRSNSGVVSAQSLQMRCQSSLLRQ